MKRFFIFVFLALMVVSLAVPAFAATDTGAIYGTYDIAPSDFAPMPSFYSAFLGTTGSFVLDGVEYPLVRISAVPGTINIWSSISPESYFTIVYGNVPQFQTLSITFDTYQLDLTGTTDKAIFEQYLFSVLRSSEWVDAPEPFFDSIGSALASLVSWLGLTLSAITSGSFVSLLPVIGISVAVSIIIFVFLLIKRSTWGE